MSKNLKKAITIFIIVVVITIATISTFYILKGNKNKENIENITKIYSDENIQEKTDIDNVKVENLMQKIDGEYVIGTIDIEKIEFQGLVYEGTSEDILAKGVGHFEESPYLNGNVCLAAHNSNKYWAKLHTLELGDKITFTSFLGTKEYKVIESTQIQETDWSKLSNTEENLLTLITCVKGKPTLRLCVQAIEIN